MGQLVVQQRLLVLTNKLAELALESGGGQREGSSAVVWEWGLLQSQGPPKGRTCGWQQPGYA